MNNISETLINQGIQDATDNPEKDINEYFSEKEGPVFIFEKGSIKKIIQPKMKKKS